MVFSAGSRTKRRAAWAGCRGLAASSPSD